MLHYKIFRQTDTRFQLWSVYPFCSSFKAFIPSKKTFIWTPPSPQQHSRLRLFPILSATAAFCLSLAFWLNDAPFQGHSAYTPLNRLDSRSGRTSWSAWWAISFFDESLCGETWPFDYSPDQYDMCFYIILINLMSQLGINDKKSWFIMWTSGPSYTGTSEDSK